MRRTQIQLDDATHEALRRRAFEEGRSMSSVVRETLAEAFGVQGAGPPRRIEDFAFVGMGSDPAPPRGTPVSEDHDRWYAEAVANRWVGAAGSAGSDGPDET
ncbi:MAG: hypothetical protein OXF93_19275 [Acidobacteria bacterium]|nr:hypothetical protein [Acidobacteriota bacterium]